MIPIRDRDIRCMIWVVDSQSDLLTRVRIRAPHRRAFNGPFLPAIDRDQRTVAKLLHVALHTTRHRDPQPPLRIALQFHRRTLQPRRSIRRCPTCRGHGPHVLRRQGFRLGRKKRQLLSALCPGQAAHRVGNIGHVLRTLRAAYIDGTGHLVMSDVRHRRERCEGRALRVPDNIAWIDGFQIAAPPAAARTIRIHDIQAGLTRLLHMAHVAQRIGTARIGHNREVLAVRRRHRRRNTARQQDDRRWHCSSLVICHRKERQLLLVLHFPPAI